MVDLANHNELLFAKKNDWDTRLPAKFTQIGPNITSKLLHDRPPSKGVSRMNFQPGQQQQPVAKPESDAFLRKSQQFNSQGYERVKRNGFAEVPR